jgi:type II secretory pathway component PulF
MVQTSNMLTYSYMSSMLLKSGLKLPQVLFYAGSTVGNRHLRESLLQARVQLLQGQSLTAVLQQTDVYTRMEVEKIAIGERTGDIAFAFENIAAAQERHWRNGERLSWPPSNRSSPSVSVLLLPSLRSQRYYRLYSLAGSIG